VAFGGGVKRVRIGNATVFKAKGLSRSSVGPRKKNHFSFVGWGNKRALTHKKFSDQPILGTQLPSKIRIKPTLGKLKRGSSQTETTVEKTESSPDPRRWRAEMLPRGGRKGESR